MTSLSALLMLTACRPSSAHAAGEPQRGDRHVAVGTKSAADPDLTFEQVLQLAQSKTIDAKKKIEKVRDEGRRAQLQMLARRILARWDNQANTYYSKTPQALENACIDTDELKRLLQRDVHATRVYVEVRVDADGRPVRASVSGGAADKQLKDAIVHSLMQKRYAPAKERDRYVDATLTIECRIEVR
jgi:TolA-binding protein